VNPSPKALASALKGYPGGAQSLADLCAKASAVSAEIFLAKTAAIHLPDGTGCLRLAGHYGLGKREQRFVAMRPSNETPQGEVMRTRRAVTSSVTRPSLIVLPLGKSPVGTLTLLFRGSHRPPLPSQRVVETVCAGIGRAIKNTRAVEAKRSGRLTGRDIGARQPIPEILRRETQELLTLESIAKALAHPQDRTEMLARAIEAVVAVTHADAGIVRVVDEERQLLTVEASIGVSTVHSIPLQNNAFVPQVKPGEIFQHRIADGPFGPEVRAALLSAGFLSVIGVPIFIKNRFAGVLTLFYQRETPPSVSTPLLEAVALQLGIALENSELFARLQAQEAEAREMGRSLSAANLQLQDSYLRLRQAHEQLLQSEKLSAMGQLISGVAHELNNPLSVVMGYAQLLLGDAKDEALRAKAEAILSQAERAAKIVRNLLTFARKSRGDRRLLNANEILDRTIELRAYHLKVDNVEVIREIDERLGPTQGDPQQLQQVLLNLINNAHYAMTTTRGRGRLSLRTFRTRDRFGRPAIGIEVTDDGPGISPEILPHVFNPFFTTKPVGEGTGLGLAICHGIIEEHGGEITCTSVPGAGASFRVTLPMFVATEERLEGDTQKAWPSPGHRILVIDDEQAVREVLREALANYGHVAHTTSSGREALRWIETLSYDLVICDMKMPDMDGKTFYAEAQARWPHLAERIVFCTGDVVNPKTQSFLQELGCRYVTKPFKVEELLSLLNPRPRKPSG